MLIFLRENKNKGFTIAELLITMAIVAILAGIMLVNVRGGEKDNLLKRGANTMGQYLRKASDLTTSFQENDCSIGTLVGYGIRLNISNPNIQVLNLFADCGKPVEQIIETLDLGKGISVSSLAVSDNGINWIAKNTVVIFFTPPDPIISIQDSVGAESNQAKIILKVTETPTKTREIIFNKFGLIEIQ